MIIGNSNSTLTNANIDAIISSENKIPFIMPIATDNNIIKKAIGAKHKAILRMLPDNNQQAETAKSFVFKLIKDNRRVAIFIDEENQSYSLNLSRDIADKIRTAGGKVLIEEFIGPSNSFYNSLNIWSNGNIKPNVIIYVGVSHHAFLLIDQLSTHNITEPIIFTDGCLVEAIFQQASSKYEGNSYILSPTELKDDEETSKKDSYMIIGQDTYKLIRFIFQKSKASRKRVYKYIATNKNEIIFSGFAGKYEFNADGNNEGRNYKVYQIIGGRTKEIKDF